MARLSQLSRSVAGKVVHVTGAASGMGRATAYLFGDEGARVAVTDRFGEDAEKVAQAIRDAGGEAEAYRGSRFRGKTSILTRFTMPSRRSRQRFWAPQ